MLRDLRFRRNIRHRQQPIQRIPFDMRLRLSGKTDAQKQTYCRDDFSHFEGDQG